MIIEVKINEALTALFSQGFRLESRLSNRVSTVVFDIEAEETWSPPSLANAQIVALGGYTRPQVKDEIQINRAPAEMENCASAGVVAFGGDSKWLDYFFGGYIATVDHKKVGIRRFYRCTAQDYNIVLHSILVNKSYTSKTEQQIIDDLFVTYWSEVDTTTHVTGDNTVASIIFERILLDEALDQLANLYGREWYLDYQKKLHYFTPSTTEAPFGLWDELFSSVKIPYYNFQFVEDATRIINRVTVIGETDEGVPIIVTRQDDASYAKYGKQWYDAKVVNKNINTVAWANLVGDAVLVESAFAKIKGKASINQEGLVVGQKVRIVNELRDIDDYYLIQLITLKMVGGEVEEAFIEFGDYSPDLVELLGRIQKLEMKES